MNVADNLRIFLMGLKTLQRPLDRVSFARLLDSFMKLLLELEEDLTDARLGLAVLVEIFESDRDFFELSPKRSRRSLHQLLEQLVVPLFALYASSYPDKPELSQLILTLNKSDRFRLRESLFDFVSLVLPESECYRLVDELWQLASAAKSARRKQRYLRAIVSVARQLQAPLILEKACLALGGKVSRAAVQDLVIMLLESGDIRESARWAERVSFGASQKNDCWDQLLIELYVHLGEMRLAELVAWRMFRRNRESWAFQELLYFLGKEQEKKVAADEMNCIMQSRQIRIVDLEFLVEMGYFKEAENYLLSHAAELHGRPRHTLVPLAQQLQDANHHLAASIIYRALLQSALKRSSYDAYHPVSYLQELDELACRVDDWRGIADHFQFKAHLNDAYRADAQFWQLYALRSA